jgi:surfactin synthase thioesterase subunit
MNLVLQNICSNRDNQQNEELIENNELFLRFLPLLLAYYKICHSQIQCRYTLSLLCNIILVNAHFYDGG